MNDQTVNDDATNPFGGPGVAGNGNVHGGPELWLRSIHDEWPSPILTKDMRDLEHWYSAERPAFSPDGRQIAYGVNVQKGGVVKHVIWISPVAGGRPWPVLTSIARTFAPASSSRVGPTSPGWARLGEA